MTTKNECYPFPKNEIFHPVPVQKTEFFGLNEIWGIN
jgi:hypothetical protein